MAQLDIKITTKYDQAQQGFEKVTKSVKSYRQELIKARSTGEGVAEAEDQYLLALNKTLQQTDYMKDGTAALKDQMKLLRREIFELNSAFGSSDDIVKDMNKSLNMVNDELKETETASGGATKSLRSVSNGMKELDKSSGGAMKKLVSIAGNILKFQLLMGPITSAIRGLKTTISDSMRVAAEAEQIYSKLATVFDGLSDAARRASDSLASTIGVAGSTSASALSTVGDLLQAQGMGTSESLEKASDWVKYFQDIIAFKDINMSLEEFAQTFMSGAAGNLRNFRTFGSIVKESTVQAELLRKGLDGLSGSELELAKMVTRAELALEQQKNAMGATEREWNTMLSVNRRLNESWKETKEIIGSFLNTSFKELKSDLSDWLDTLNKTYSILEAMKQEKLLSSLGEGLSTSSINAIVEAADTLKGSAEGLNLWQKFMAKSIKRATDTSLGGSILAGLNPMALIAKLVIAATGKDSAALNANANAYLSQSTEMSSSELSRLAIGIQKSIGVGFDDTLKILRDEGYKIADIAEKTAKDIYDREMLRIATVETQEKALLSMKEIGASVTGYNDAVSNILKGQDFKTFMRDNIFADTSSADYLLGRNKGTASENADAAASLLVSLISEIVNSDSLARQSFNQYGNLYDESLARLKEHGTYRTNATGGQTLYYDSSKGWTAEEWNQEIEVYKSAKTAMEQINELLNEWAGLYVEATDELKRIYANAARDELLGSLSGTTSDYKQKLQRMGWSDQQNALQDIDDAWSAFYRSEEAKSFSSDEILEFLAAVKEAKDAVKAYYEEVDRLAHEEDINNALVSYGTATGDYQRQLAQLGMSDNEKAADDLKRKFEDLLATLQPTEEEYKKLYAAYKNEEKALIDLQKATDEASKAEWRKALGDSVNPIAHYVDVYKQGQENFDFKGGGLIALLIELLKNTETFKVVMSIVNDTIVPILDAILKPLLPALKVIQQFMDNLPWDELFVIMQLVSGVIVVAFDVISRILGTISAVVKTIYYAITFQWGKISEVWSDFMDDQRRITERTQAALEEIGDTVFKIERNTDTDVLKTLNELFSRGIINEGQYNAGARVLQKDMVFDPVVPSYPSYAASAPSTTTVSYGGITIVINGNDPAEIERTLNRYFERQGISYNEPLALGGY